MDAWIFFSQILLQFLLRVCHFRPVSPKLYIEQCEERKVENKYILRLFYKHIVDTKLNLSFGVLKSSICDARGNPSPNIFSLLSPWRQFTLKWQSLTKKCYITNHGFAENHAAAKFINLKIFLPKANAVVRLRSILYNECRPQIIFFKMDGRYRQ